MTGSDPDIHTEIEAVWNEYDDEQYRRDQSHWRGEGRWDDQRWEQIGRTTKSRLMPFFGERRRPWPNDRALTLLEWGPGGGSNLHALANVARTIFAIDISAKNLEESSRIVAETECDDYRPVLLTGDPDEIGQFVQVPIDLIISTAVFQHFPSKTYAGEVLRVMESLLAPDGLGYVQIRYDDGNPKYAPKPLRDYRKHHITATSFELAEFWSLLLDVGLMPVKIANLNTRINYASFYFANSA